jgi:hypothetical protein
MQTTFKLRAATAQPHLLSASSSLQPNKSRNDDSHTNTYQNPLNSNSQIVKPVYPQQSNYYCNPPKLDEKRRNFSPPSHQKRSIKNQRKFNSDTNCFIPIPSTVPFDGGVQGAFLLNFDGQKILPVANNCHSIVFAKPPSAGKIIFQQQIYLKYN